MHGHFNHLNALAQLVLDWILFMAAVTLAMAWEAYFFTLHYLAAAFHVLGHHSAFIAYATMAIVTMSEAYCARLMQVLHPEDWGHLHVARICAIHSMAYWTITLSSHS